MIRMTIVCVKAKMYSPWYWFSCPIGPNLFASCAPSYPRGARQIPALPGSRRSRFRWALTYTNAGMYYNFGTEPTSLLLAAP